jgi:twinkle protein
MFGMERDQQAEDITERQTTTFRVLKDRYTGQSTGMTIPLNYNSETGHLYEKTVFDTVRLVDELEAF